MKATIYQGKNAGTLPFNILGTLKVFDKRGVKNYEKAINSLFQSVEQIGMLIYNLEKVKNSEYYHSHLLLKVEDTSKFYDGVKRFINSVSCYSEKRRTLVKTLKPPEMVKDGVPFMDKWVDSDATIITGKTMQIEYENIASPSNASIYCFKFSDYGIHNGFLKRK